MSTLTPFLYQTRTLSNYSWVRPRLIRGARCNGGVSRRCYTDRPRGPDPYALRNNLSEEIESGTRLGKSTGTSSPASKSSIVEDLRGPKTLWSSLLEDGSQRLDGGETKYTSKQIEDVESEETEDWYDGQISLPEKAQLDEEFDDLAMPDTKEMEDFSITYGNRKSTITTSEKAAFQRIFTDVQNRLRSRLQATGLDASDLDLESPSAITFSNRRKAQNQLESIIGMAVERIPASPDLERVEPSAAGTTQTIGSETDLNIATRSQKDNLWPQFEELERKREEERARVEKRMKDADTDFNLWNVLETEVFSLISKMGLEDPSSQTKAETSSDHEHLQLDLTMAPPSSTHPTATKNGKKSKAKNSKNKNAAQSAVDLEKADGQHVNAGDKESVQQISDLALYGPLYPSYLLLALRLFDRSFSRQSPFTLSLLPKIKSLGVISHVLGATTQFYNELLRIYQFRYDDYRGILSLLDEMEQAAVDFDEETLAIVLDILKARLRIVRQCTNGPVLQAVWRMPEFAPNKFPSWKIKIEHHIAEKEASRE